MIEGKVSVIIPAYNVEKYVQKCVESVMNQTYKNLEILCVNDGSTDETFKILSSLACCDSRINLINQQNQGLSGARNTGLENCSGEYVMFLDGDDWIDNNAVEKSVEQIKEENAQLVMWNYIREFPGTSVPKNIFAEHKLVFENESMTHLHRRMAGLMSKELADPSNADSAVTAWGKLYTAQCLENCRFTDTKLIGTEDALFSLQALCNVKKAVFIGEYFNHYRKDNLSSLTRKYKPSLFWQWQTLYDKMAQVIKENSLPFEDVLDNRIALSIIGLGLNELINTTSFFEKSKKIKEIISSPRYKRAYKNLPLKYFPIHWKVFFAFCKASNGIGVLILLKCIDKIISR